MRRLLLFLALLAPAWVSAQGGAPLEIEADQVLLDEARGVSIYRGRVQAVQGPLSIHADELRLYREGGRLVRVEADGRPARLQDRRPGRSPLEARAQHIDYRPSERRVVLEGEAELRQGRDRFQGPRIEYDLAAQRVRAGGDGGRVRVIISPETLQGEGP